MQSYSYIDIFSGCGGLGFGLKNSGWQGIFALEKSEDAFATLAHNLINTNHYDWPNWLPIKNHDINEVLCNHEDNLASLRGKIMLVAGGPPCQGFSTAGRRNPNDERNTLFESYIRFVELVRPNFVFFENVKGFTVGFKEKSENLRGEAYSKKVTLGLERLGYDLSAQMVDFSGFGIPQKRERFILVGWLHGKASLFFERLETVKKNVLLKHGLPESSNVQDALSDLLMSNGKKISPDNKNFKAGKYSEAYTPYQLFMRNELKHENAVVDSHRFSNHNPSTVKKFKFAHRNLERGANIAKELNKKFPSKKTTLILLDPHKCSPTLTTLPDDYIHYAEPRIMTVREYARLQTFPDHYEFKGKYTTGSQMRKLEVPRYTQIGNAIPPLFSEIAGESLKRMEAT